MRKLFLAGIVPALMFCASGCGAGEMSTAAVDDTVPKDSLEEPRVAELGIGDPAPPIAIAKWVKGEPVTAFNPEKVYVVEFWATWCAPCLAGMPHIAALQTEYGEKVTIIGVSIEDDAAVAVAEFMEKTASESDKTWSEMLTYTIALDDEKKTSAAYMEAAGQEGIPCAFIVGRSGKIEWIGYPAEMDEPLKQIVDGTWNLEKARVDFLAAREKDEAFLKLQRIVGDGDFKAGVQLVDQLITKFPNDKDFPMVRFRLLLRGGMMDDANKAAAGLIEVSKDNAMILNAIAWMMTTGSEEPGVDLNLAHSAAQRAAELTEEKDDSVLETLALITFKQGKVAEAVALQKKAVELAPEAERYAASLEEFEAALKALGEPAAEGTPAKEEKPADPATPPGN